MQYQAQFFGQDTGGKRKRHGRAAVEAKDALSALEAAKATLAKAPPKIQQAVTEIRIEAVTTGVKWASVPKE